MLLQSWIDHKRHVLNADMITLWRNLQLPCQFSTLSECAVNLFIVILRRLEGYINPSCSVHLTNNVIYGSTRDKLICILDTILI